MSALAWKQLQPHADLTADAALRQQHGAGGSSGPPPMPDDRLLRATRAMGLKDYEAALRLLGLEAAEKPESFIVFDLRAGCCLQAGRLDQALDDAMHCTKLNPEWARGWARLAAAQLCLGHPRAAASAYRRGLELDPASREMQTGLQLAQQALGTQAAAGPSRRRAQHHT